MAGYQEQINKMAAECGYAGPKLVIGGNNVTEITRDTAQVGCTRVTRAEAEALLAEMNKVPETKDFEISRDTKDKYFLTFSIRHSRGGWLNTQEDAHASDPVSGYSAQVAFFCLENSNAEKLLKFLTEQLGYVAYKLSTTSAGAPQKYVIEFRTKRNGIGQGNWSRSGNKSAALEFSSLAEATAEAERQTRTMGPEFYEYRARPI